MSPVECPYEIQHRAYDAARVLLEDFSDQITLAQSVTAAVVVFGGPECVGWEYAGELLAGYSQIAGRRV